LVKVTQGSVFRDFDDPNPGIRQNRGEQPPRFCHAQTISMGKIRRRHFLFAQNVYVEAQQVGSFRICIVFIVLYSWLEFEEKLLVLGVVAGALVIFAREAFDGFERIPQRDR